MQYWYQALLAELFIIVVSRFCHAIVVKYHAVATLQLHRAALEGLVCKNAENDAALAEAFMRAITMQNKGWIVTGANVAQLARRTIELRIHQPPPPLTPPPTPQPRLQPPAPTLPPHTPPPHAAPPPP